MQLAKKAREALLSKKGGDVVILDARKVSSITDYLVICTGNNPPHLKALAEELEQVLRKEGVHSFRRAGDPESQWIVVDYIDAVVHLFSPDTRRYYALEQLWSDAPRIS